MVLAAFDVYDQVSFAVVVFARDGDHARRLGDDHRKSLTGNGSGPIHVMERLPMLGGVARDHHLAAVRDDVPGVGHQQPDGSWLLLPPGVRPINSLRPKPTTMFHFSDDDGYEVVLFAHTRRRAKHLYKAILQDYLVLPREWRGSEFETWLAIGLVRHQGQAEDRGVEGIGIYNLYGWLILPIDYEMLGVGSPE